MFDTFIVWIAHLQPAVDMMQPAYYLPVQHSQAHAPVAAPQPPAPQLTCDWSEHTSPEGYKYYYNSTTRESKVCY